MKKLNLKITWATSLILYLNQQCMCECTYMHSRGSHPTGKWKWMSGMEPVCTCLHGDNSHYWVYNSRTRSPDSHEEVASEIKSTQQNITTSFFRSSSCYEQEFPCRCFSRRSMHTPSAATNLHDLPSVWSSEEATDLCWGQVKELLPWQTFCCMFVLV